MLNLIKLFVKLFIMSSFMFSVGEHMYESPILKNSNGEELNPNEDPNVNTLTGLDLLEDLDENFTLNLRFDRVQFRLFSNFLVSIYQGMGGTFRPWFRLIQCDSTEAIYHISLFSIFTFEHFDVFILVQRHSYVDVRYFASANYFILNFLFGMVFMTIIKIEIILLSLLDDMFKNVFFNNIVIMIFFIIFVTRVGLEYFE